jgi:GAF domain-containing protein
VSMNKYLIYTEDQQLIEKLRATFSNRQIQFKGIAEFPVWEEDTNLVVVDGDSLLPSDSLLKLRKFKREKIPVVFIFSALDGKEVMDVLKLGVISVLFKDYTGEWIKSELRDILFNFNYLEKVKEIAENDNRNKKFLNVVNSLTSDNDINKIMNDILESMADVFKLKCTLFFIVKKGRLTQKIKLGRCIQDYKGDGWDLTDRRVKWLAQLQRSRSPLYITHRSPRDYKEDFTENTLLLPLAIKEKFFGLISATLPPGAKKLTRSEISLLRAFAEQTSVALENAKLYWDVIRAREMLIKQEKKALLNQTIISLNHEINNPLSIISMEAEMLHQKLEKNENKLESRIGKIEINIERIKGILEKISALNVDDHIATEYITGQKMLNLYEN